MWFRACDKGVFLEPPQVVGGLGTVAALKGMPRSGSARSCAGTRRHLDPT